MVMRITNKKEFSAKIKEFARLSSINVGTVAKLTAFKAFESVVEKTPVDTGWARASWNITVNEIDPSYPEKPAKGTRLPDPPAPPVSLGAGDDLPKFFITNNLPYIVYLEYPREGITFKQPDKGEMVQRTMNVIRLYLDDAIGALK